MNTYFVGEAIRLKRIELGLTQEELSEGICEHSTLSRIETGRQAPSRTVLHCLLEKLDLPAERYYGFVDQRDMEIENLKTEITSCSVLKKRELGLNLLNKLEHLLPKDDHINRQFILKTKVILGKRIDAQIVPYDPQEKLEMLLQAIKFTVPRFEVDDINKFLYSVDEIKIINQIAMAYSVIGQQHTSLDIWNQLMKYIKKNHHLAIRNRGVQALVAYNYSRELYLATRYKEALEIAEIGKNAAVQYGQYLCLPAIYSVMAECYVKLDMFELARDKYFESYYIFKGIGNLSEANIIKKDAKENLNIDLD